MRQLSTKSGFLPRPVSGEPLRAEATVKCYRSCDSISLRAEARLTGTGRFDIHLSVPLVLEYEEVLLRELPRLQIGRGAVEDLIDFHCTVATCHPIFFLWRPFLPDPGDDMILELAVKAGCEFIVTYNTRDFAGVEQFGLRVIEPGAFLQHIGALP